MLGKTVTAPREKEIVIAVFEAEMMSFGTEAIDELGRTSRFPQASMLTGMIANALGWKSTEKDKLQYLQDHLEFSARIDRDPRNGVPITDFQTAMIERGQSAWTTRGTPITRAGGKYKTTIRKRDYLEDTRVTVAIGLNAETSPEKITIEEIAQALSLPARPLFIGRASCIPSEQIFREIRTQESTLAALLETPLEYREAPDRVLLYWPAEETPSPEIRIDQPNLNVTDERNWHSGLHGGGRTVMIGSAPRERFPEEEKE